ncbi:S-layer homology domain-containing protein [Peptoniphilus stercorisuis]|uniref:SLH domain-containing protein n=1 Tax=Peptoniphilus stercorisuis TaxID=1436965 RepID=A0ABS4KAM9_9FIRM|nr:S-layer homology domain-containing protein [Peptoniphilus stercorisuis]MBP2024836.1 hypothetical protein [Peptoniphilus stercorisuis]
MKKGKKVLLILFTFLIIFNSSSIYAQKFQDTKGHWAASYVDKLSDSGIMTGYDGNNFKPDSYISRAEFYSVVNQMAGLDKTYTVTFSDVSTSDWFYNDVAKGIKAGYLTPTTGNLNPNKPITRQEVTGILGYMYKVTPDESVLKKFKDQSAISSDNRGYTGALVKLKIVDGYEDNTFRPNAGITRGEISKIICLLMDGYGLPGKRVVVDSKIKFGDRSLYK